MSREQEKIDRKIIDAKILELLYAYPADMAWSKSSLSRVSRIDYEDVLSSIGRLLYDGLITDYRAEYTITDFGRECYKEALDKPYIGSILAWRNEVSTGMTASGNRSGIENPVLPKPEGAPRSTATAEERYAQMELDRLAKEKASSILGIAIDEYEQRVNDGSIRVCKGTELDSNGEQIEHVGIFDPDGKGWQRRCKECRKKTRKK